MWFTTDLESDDATSLSTESPTGKHLCCFPNQSGSLGALPNLLVLAARPLASGDKQVKLRVHDIT